MFNLPETIFTLNARDNIILDLLNSYKPDRSTIYETINIEFQDCLLTLSDKKINYQDLKNCLVPSTNRNEIALVFDRTKINSFSYGQEVISQIIPLFDLQSCHSIMHGDYIGDHNKDKMSLLFFENIISQKSIIYIENNQFYIVYINNLSDRMIQSFNEGLYQFGAYVGYFNLTYSSILKTYLSFILVNAFIKNKTTIISSQDEDSDPTETDNSSLYDFNNKGLVYKSIPSRYFDLFLTYKIEREVFEGFKSDSEFSINAVTVNVLDISDFNIKISPEKFQYLFREKAGTLHPVGITDLEINDLELLIRERINKNYLYNLTFNKQFNTLKFNIVLEFKRNDNKRKMKLLLAFEYLPNDKILRLITMY